MGWEDLKGKYLHMYVEPISELLDPLRELLSQYLSEKITNEIIDRFAKIVGGKYLTYLSFVSDEEDEALRRYREQEKFATMMRLIKPKPFLVKLIEVMK